MVMGYVSNVLWVLSPLRLGLLHATLVTVDMNLMIRGKHASPAVLAPTARMLEYARSVPAGPCLGSVDPAVVSRVKQGLK